MTEKQPEKDNPKGVSEVDRIKWFISRIDLHHKNNLDSITMLEMIIAQSYPTGLDYVTKEQEKDAITQIIRSREKLMNIVHSFPINFGKGSVKPSKDK